MPIGYIKILYYHSADDYSFNYNIDDLWNKTPPGWLDTTFEQLKSYYVRLGVSQCLIEDDDLILRWEYNNQYYSTQEIEYMLKLLAFV
jgi:hypothetical protein